jgi:RNA polymerase sigma-70 factor (ECF subfamily)
MARVSPSTEFDPARLIVEHQTGIWRYLRALGCDPPLAEDLTQETFLAVLEKPFSDYHPIATGAYLRRVARNLFISFRRRSDTAISVANVDAIDARWSRWAGESDGGELLETLKECLAALGERARESLDMRYRDKRSREEIAAALGVGVHGAKNLMQRARQTLRECIERKMK